MKHIPLILFIAVLILTLISSGPLVMLIIGMFWFLVWMIIKYSFRAIRSLL